ncbi:MAG: GNAT family N-acetyltransferase [Reyranellaceae bacterium]|jgi:predicted GNAT family N-acyltransferase
MTTQTTLAPPALTPVVTIKIASTSDEMLQCYALRAAVFMGEQACPYDEEFDGNDYTATHVIMYVDGEPAGSMRLRWFQSFCKFERCVVLRRYRGLGIHHEINAWCKDFARRKGYTKAYIHLQKRHMPMMEKEGFRRVDDTVFKFSDHEYYAIYCDLAPSDDAITLQSAPMVVNRPEDRLDEEGVLELSAERGATNPHAPHAPRLERHAN